MLVNNSVLDNEFFECDIPFELNASALRHPIEWFSSKKRLFVPRYFPDSCVRYMVTFLAQYGKKWLQDSRRVKTEVKKENGLLVGNFLHLANLLTFESHVNQQEKNWSHTWSRILMSRELYKCYVDDETSEQLRMPFGFNSGKATETGEESSGDVPRRLFEVSFERYESKIKRLIDSLPPGLFEQDDPKVLEIIQNICSLDLENFLLFLQINPVEPLDTTRGRKPTASVVDDGPESKEIAENTSTHGNVITTRYVPCHVTDTIGETRNCVNIEHEDVLVEKIGPGLSELPSKWFETEFLLHLENLSAISHCFFTGATRSEKIDWHAYLKQFRVDPSVSSFFETGLYKPNCLSQSYYWGEYYLPRSSPPALGDSELVHLKHSSKAEEAMEAKSIRFIGYIMEIVRNRLAKWTASAHVSKLRKYGWTTEIPYEWSMKFRAKSDLSLLCYTFENQKEISSIRIPKREDDARLYGNRLWTCHEQVLWECQQHLLELLSDDEREYGPQNVELILLFLLGFPVLNFSQSTYIGRQPYPWVLVTHLWPVVPDSKFRLDFFLKGKSPNDVYIEMRIHRKYSAFESDDLSHRKRGVEFCWEDWIHLFEGCMKTLSLDFNKNDFREERTVEELDRDGDNDDEGRGVSEDTKTKVETVRANKCGKSEHVADQDYNKKGIEDGGNGGWESNDKVGEEKPADMVRSMRDDDTFVFCGNALEETDEIESEGNGSGALEGEKKCEDQIWNKKEDDGDDSESNELNMVSSESERSGDDRSDPSMSGAESMGNATRRGTSASTISEAVGWDDVKRCACEYRLDKRAEKRIIEGKNKYYWHWEGWKPQPAFQKFRFLYELERPDNGNETSAEEKDEVDVESCLQATGGEEAEETASNEEGSEEESVLTLTDGEEMV
ncbi:DGF-1-like protein [Gracilaria domingensis]|nr:DGF-1-like protein [Gracilaria domingensis]